MAFIVEDGSVVAGANSYATPEYAASYFADQGRADEFAGTQDQQRGWLVQGTRYIDLRWGSRVAGAPFASAQPLVFPRAALDGAAWMPDALLRAACEYAVRAKLGPLAPDQAAQPSVVMVGKTIGPISRRWEVVDKGAQSGSFRSYPLADSLIAGLLRPAGRRVIR